MSDDPYDRDPLNMLFVCENNSALSIMAEALLNKFGGDKFRAFSVGIQPAEQVDPAILALLQQRNLPTGAVSCKSVSRFCASSAPRFDFVIALSELVPTHQFPGDPLIARWHITDPDDGAFDQTQHRNALRYALRELEIRIGLFVLLRHETRDMHFRGSASDGGKRGQSGEALTFVKSDQLRTPFRSAINLGPANARF